MNNINNHYTETRPWGSYEILSEFEVSEPGFKDVCVKKLIINPLQKISYQTHKQRAEHWLIVEGQGVVILNDVEIPVRVGSAVDIKIGDKHRVMNTEPEKKLVIIETQTGHYDEEDIERLEDEYGNRKKSNGYRGKFNN
jgi:mannose-6-phosphate isomerase